MKRFLTIALLLLAGTGLSVGSAQAQGAIADHTVIADFESIPFNWVDSVSQNIQMYYLHQSHGSQIMQGMAMLHDDDSRYYPHRMEAEWWLYPNGLEVGQDGDTGWVAQVRRYLDTNSVNCNVVSVSWCAGANTLNQTETVKYLTGWRNMERDYPNVTFVYQTSRLTKVDWPDAMRQAILRTNQQIREWCADSGCYLMDYGAIEGHEPDGSYDEYATDSCTTWCDDYCDTASGGCPGCVNDIFNSIWNRSIMGPTDYCAHATASSGDSHGCLVCYRKGKAWWWLMAKVVQDKSGGDVTPPIISNVQVVDIAEDSARVTWTTNEPATSRVEYGYNTNYGWLTTLDPTLTTSHDVILGSLDAATSYHCRPRSVDEVGNERLGADQSFTTATPPPPDTVTIESKSVAIDAGTVTVAVSLSNHQELAAFDIPIRWDSPDITCDSVSYVGSRVEYVNLKPVEIDSAGQKLHAGMLIVAESYLTPGSGLILTLYYSVNPGAAEQTISIDTTFFPPTGSFILTSSTAEILRPVRVSGQLSLFLAADTTPPSQIDDLGAAPAYFNSLFRQGTALAVRGGDIADMVYFQRSLLRR